MLIALTGGPRSGKKTLAKYLEEEHNFVVLDLNQLIFQSASDKSSEAKSKKELLYEILNKGTAQWGTKFVVTPITQPTEIEILRKRPNVTVIGLDVPFDVRVSRLHREVRRPPPVDACRSEDEENDWIFNTLQNSLRLKNMSIGDIRREIENHPIFSLKYRDYYDDKQCGIKQIFLFLSLLDANMNHSKGDGFGQIAKCMRICDKVIDNSGTTSELYAQANDLESMADEIIRPSWDTYFMRMAFLASSRSNCLKRRVGAVLTIDRRVVATGYNGTAFKTLNCKEGGCARCENGNIEQGEALTECECLHAEANALLEAGNSRSKGCSLYSTAMPCLSCAKLIVQSGVNRVVYGMPYDDGGNAKCLLAKADVSVILYSDVQPHFPLSSVGPFFPVS